MRSVISFLIFQFFLAFVCYAQDDSAAIQPSVDTAIKKIVVDTAQKKVVRKKPVDVVLVKSDSIPIQQAILSPQNELLKNQLDTTVKASGSSYGDYVSPFIISHPYFDTKDNVLNISSKPYKADNKDELFYIICFTLLFLGILRVSFPKYFNDLFNAFWRSTRQKQIRDQLQQAE